MKLAFPMRSERLRKSSACSAERFSLNSCGSSGNLAAMRRFVARLFVLAPMLVLLSPIAYRSFAHVQPEGAFRLTIVDANTGHGGPGVPVRSDNGILCHTRSNGEIAWTELSLMDRDVRFTIDRPDGKPDAVTLHVTRGNRAHIRLP